MTSSRRELPEEERRRKRAVRAQYEERNRDRINRLSRERYARDAERICERKRETAAARKARDPEAYRLARHATYERNREYFVHWARSHPVSIAKAAKKWRDNNRNRVRELHLLGRFKLAKEAYDAMLVAQGGVCAICGRAERVVDPRTKQLRSLAVDHCHATGRVRGLLCFSCNVAIGFLGDSPQVAEAARAYLERTSCEAI